MRHACAVVYARTGPDATRVFLLPVSGNNQHAEPGEELPEPLVVRLEDQFGNPILSEPLVANILQGEGSILEADDNIMLVADSRTGLLVLDVSAPTQPVHLHTLPPSDAVGTPRDEKVWSVIVHCSRAYLGIGSPAQLYVVDLTDPRHPDFTADADGDGTADVIRSILDFPGEVSGHLISDIAVRGPIVYALSNTLSDTLASLYIVDVQEPTPPQLIHTVPLPTGNPTGMAVVDNFLYVAAETTGLLTFDLSDPTRPTLVPTLSDPDPQDDLDVTLTSAIATEGDQLYVVETQGQGQAEPSDYLTVMDLSTPSRPRRQGRVQITTKPQLSRQHRFS